MRLIHSLLTIVIISLGLSGCSSLGKGVTEAILEKQQDADTRVCEIWGKPFVGLSPYLNNQNGKLKVLMIHGVGNHIPGYATEFSEKLAKELDLPAMASHYKTIYLTDRFNQNKNLGSLRISRLLSKDQQKELLFYELTWSAITAKQKEVLAYDNSGEYSFRRAEVNDLLKKFSNDTGPDPIIYLGDSREDILVSFAQAFCWMTKSNWTQLPSDVTEACAFNEDSKVDNLLNDHYAFVSHSLGSRITIDGMQRIASFINNRDADFRNTFKLKEIPVYMLSNQLPMLQLGRKIPDVSNQQADYCQPAGAKYDERILTKMPVIAFSDPNDLLSYAIPQGFAEKYLDSRLCINVTNININVAKIFDAFGLGRLANPLEAHVNYDKDDRVIALIAHGLNNLSRPKIIKDRCHWVETID